MASQSLSSASQPGFMIPVEVKAEHSSSKIFVMLIILGVLVGVIMFIYYTHHHRNRKRDTDAINNVPMSVRNVTNTPQHLLLPGGQRVTIQPGDTAEMTVPQNSNIRTETFLSSGEVIRDRFQVISTNPKQPLEFYFTNSGVRSPTSISRDVRFVNNAPYPVIFVERTAQNGRRWGSDIVPPFSEITSDVIGNGTMWEVVHPTDEDNPIAKTTTGFRNQAIIFDGAKLISV